MLILLICLFFTCLQFAFSGTIWASIEVPPIYNTLANANVYCDYTFTFSTETFISSGGVLQVVFPDQYQKLDTDSLTAKCSLPCTVQSRTVSLTFQTDIYNNTKQQVTIYNILNPENQGGVGSFILRTKQGSNIVDENLIFGIIGIASTKNSLTSAAINLHPQGSSNAGDYTSYLLSFKVTNNIPGSTYFKLTIPPNFVIEKFPTCQAPVVNNIFIPGDLKCETIGRIIFVNGINDNLLTGFTYTLQFSITNPPFSGYTGNFVMGIYKYGTQIIYESKEDIAPILITPAIINSISMTPIDTDAINGRYKYADYELKFIPTSPLQYGNMIKIEFPAYFRVLQQTDYPNPAVAFPFQMHYIKYGLEDISQDNIVSVERDPISIYQILRITNFQTMQFAKEISVIIRTMNPDSPGLTTPLKLYFYTDKTENVLIAQDVSQASTQITDITSGHQLSPLPAAMSASNSLADLNPTNLVFEIKPIRAVSTGGFIEVRIPPQFGISQTISNTNCVIYNKIKTATPSFGTAQNSNTCILTNNRIRMQLPLGVSFLGNEGSVINNIYKFSITGNIITTPIQNGTYFFEITTIDTNGINKLENYKNYLIIKERLLNSASAVMLNSQQSQSGILDLKFTTLQEFPSGGYQYQTLDAQGIIELQFTGGLANLGMASYQNNTLIPCQGISGISPAVGANINCTLQHQYSLTLPTFGATTIPAKIIIKNFLLIPSNSNVRILIPGFQNPAAASFTLNLKLIKLENRIYQILNSYSMAVTISNAFGSTSQTNKLTFSTKIIGQVFDLTINTMLTTVTANYYLLVTLPTYDVGFIRDENTIGCNINTVGVYCIPFSGVDWILINVPSYNLATTSIEIKNLQWPRYQVSLGAIKVYSINPANGNLQQNCQSHTLSPINAPLPNTFKEASIIVPKKGLSYIDCTYVFRLVPDSPIPAGSEIQITFPNLYNLLSSNPLPQFSTEGLDQQSSTQNITITSLIVDLRITGFDTIKGGQVFYIKAIGMKNPSSPSSMKSTGWNIKVSYQSNLILQQQNFFSFDYTDAFQPGFIVFNSITAFPMNAAEQADYFIQFTPTTEIPEKGMISITFPQAQFKSLPSPPYCRLTGAVKTFLSCTLTGSTFQLQIAEKYNPGTGSIQLEIRDVKNPDLGTSDGFQITSSYDSLFLDITDSSTLAGRTITIEQAARPIDVQSLVFDPQNEGEEAQYTFKFVTTDSLDSTMEIILLFPSDYDKLLGNSIQCKIFGGLIGSAITCSVSNRLIKINNFEAYTPTNDNPIIITVYGIINPNFYEGTTTGYIRLAVRYIGSSSFLNSEQQAAKFTMLKAPGWLQLSSIVSQHFNVRYKSNYQFTFLMSQKVPKKSSRGAVLIDYPSQFPIPERRVTCSTNFSSFAAILTCMAYRNRINITGNTQDYVGSLSIDLDLIENPIDAGYSDNIYVKTYDGLNTKIIERSFKNLDPFTFLYKYPGPLIHINNDQTIFVERGTQTADLYVSLDYPAALELIIKPKESPGFTILPYDIPIHLGDMYIKFRISCSMNFNDGLFSLDWLTLNDLIPAFYTPIKTTYVNVTSARSIPIHVNTILDLPYGGSSLQTVFSLDYAPDVNIEIELNLAQMYKGIQLDKSKLIFLAGDNTQNFTVISNLSITQGVDAARGKIALVLTGTNKDIYSLPVSNLFFTLIAADSLNPTITYFEFANILKNSAEMVIKASEPVMVHYVLALNGTAVPSLEEIQSFGPAKYNTTQSRYGLAIIRSDLTNATIKFNQLWAQTLYVVHVYLVDRGNLVSQVSSKSFQTQDRYSAADFSLKFKVRSLSDDEQQFIIRNVAFILSLKQEYIQKKKYYFESKRNLQVIEQIHTFLDLQIASNRFSEYYPTPLFMAQSLNNKTSLLLASMPTIDDTYIINPSEFVKYYPSFVVPPTVIAINYYMATFQVRLSDYGFVYLICIPYTSDTQQTPSPDQIYWGLNYLNVPVPQTSVEISKSYTDFTVSMYDLQPLTWYYAYLVGGSAHPGYPDLMPMKKIAKIKFMTTEAPAELFLNINYQCRIYPVEAILLISLILFFYIIII